MPDALLRRIAHRWTAAPAVSCAGCLRLGALIGLTAGFLEVAHLGFRRLALGQLLRQSEHSVWLAPLCYLVLFAAAGAALAAVAARRPRLVSLPAALAVLVTAAAWCHLLLLPVLDRGARALLALGVGLAMARLGARRPAGVERLGRRALPWMLALVPAAAAAVFAVRAWPAPAPPPAPAGATNVLLVVLDTVRADHLGTYGYARATMPRLDRLAAGGVVFERAISTSPWTLPSHATMFTGRYPSETSAGWTRPLDGRHRALAEVFAAHGYATAGFAGNLMYCSRESGLARGFAHYEDFALDAATLVQSTAPGRRLLARLLGPRRRQLAKIDAETTADRFCRWLDDQDGRPFFAFVNFIDAHAPHLVPIADVEPFGHPATDYGAWGAKSTWSESELRGYVDAYDSCLRYVDRQLGRVLDALDARGLRERTLIVVTADHGEHFGEHGLTDHGNSLYLPLLHIPLVLTLPPRLPPTRIARTVTLRDLPATLLDLTALAPNPPFPGHSLTPLIHPPPQTTAPRTNRPTTSPVLAQLAAGLATPPWEPRSRGDMSTLFDDHLQLILNGDGTRELYAVFPPHPPDHLPLPITAEAETSLHSKLAAHLAQLRSASSHD